MGMTHLRASRDVIAKEMGACCGFFLSPLATAGSKRADTQGLEVQVIGEEEFLEMVEDGSARS